MTPCLPSAGVRLKHTGPRDKKRQGWLYFLWRLRGIHVCTRMLQVFHQSVVNSAISYTAMCWGWMVRVRDANKLSKVVRKAGSVLRAGLWR